MRTLHFTKSQILERWPKRIVFLFWIAAGCAPAPQSNRSTESRAALPAPLPAASHLDQNDPDSALNPQPSLLGHASPVPAASATPSASATPDAVPSAEQDPDDIDEGMWIGSFFPEFDMREPGCTSKAECWHAPKKTPKNRAKAPFSSCNLEQRQTDIDPSSTRRARARIANDACCYIVRVCKRPVRMHSKGSL